MLKSSSRKKQAATVVVQLIDMPLAGLRAEWQRRYGQGATTVHQTTLTPVMPRSNIAPPWAASRSDTV
jgi:hypothetical protein